MSQLSKSAFRSILAVLGGVGGLAIWALAEPLSDLEMAHPLYLFLWALTFAFFVSAMTAMGPLPLRKAVISGAVVGLPVAALLALASLRFATLNDAMDGGRLIFATLLLISLALPFVICALRDGAWRDYNALFDTSWRLVVHFTAAWIFAGLCWAVFFVSSVLLDLVGISLLEDLAREEMFAFTFTGVVLGLGLAVIFELSDYISPYLVLSLLRLLLIPVVIIVTIFLLALPFRGLSGLFSTLSPALVMMSIALGLIALISVAVERDDEDAVAGPVMQATARYACVLLVLLTGLAVYAVVLRVGTYGLTPQRFAALFIACVTLAYGIAYLVSVLRGPDWMARVRAANVALALGVIAALAICMTPLVNPQALSVNSQLARFEAGRISADQLPLDAMRNDWGRAGTAAIAELQTRDDPLLVAALAAVRSNDSTLTAQERRAASVDVLRTQLPVRPEGTAFPETALSQLSEWELARARRACALPDGPGCVLVVGDFLPMQDGPEYVMVLRNSGEGFALHWVLQGRSTFTNLRRPDEDAVAVIDGILSGDFTIAPVQMNALDVGGRVFNPFN